MTSYSLSAYVVFFQGGKIGGLYFLIRLKMARIILRHLKSIYSRTYNSSFFFSLIDPTESSSMLIDHDFDLQFSGYLAA